MTPESRSPGADPGVHSYLAPTSPGEGRDPDGDLPPRPSWLRRWRWVLGAVLVLIWLAVGGIGGPYSGKLSQVQKNDTSSFLPADAESSVAAERATRFAESQTFPAFLLLESDSALASAQFAAVQEFAQRIPTLQIPVAGNPSVPVGDYLAEGPVVVLPSQDGKAALALINFDFADFGTTLADGESPIQRAVEVIREADDELATNGARAYVAGPGGGIADLIKAFGGIDGILLLVALATVAVILLIVYRSPVIPIFVLLSAGLALTLASVVVYFLAKNDVITLDGQGQGILSILVIGAATDYALLLVARYREELRRHDDRYEAMWLAWRRAFEPILASGATVIIGLLCLLLSDLGPTKGLGPVGAIGIAAAMLSALTFLPAVLVLPGRNSAGEHGRWVFWPGVPHVGTEGPETRGIWARVAGLVGSHPRRVWTITALVLLGLAAFLPTLKAEGVSQADTFLTEVESTVGDKALAEHFPGGSGSPALVIGPADKATELQQAVAAAPGVASSQWTVESNGGPVDPAAPPKQVDGLVQLQVTLADPADSPAAYETVRRLRTDLDAVSPQILVGGNTATNLDVLDISEADRNLIIPVILAVIFVVLALLLRALVAPVLIIAANVLSFAATLGTAAIMFNHVFGFAGSDPSVTLYGFVFLVALGIDYSIFLMTRVREESIAQGTRRGVLAGLAVTGGVITSAGVVLAATFAALGVLPILFLAQIAFIVAFGVLLDTLVVRSLLVPALSHDIGRAIWRPSRLARGDQ
ncbi:MAG: MMPL family transporter [Kineosporiaceae bacterium]|nr:MMPL family transporter [Kineosporiaceae bacterium]